MSWMDWHFHFIYFHVNWKFARKKLSLVKQNIVRHMASCTNFKRFSGIVYSAFNVHDLIRWNDLNSKWASIKIIDNVQMYTKTVIDWLHGDEEGEKKRKLVVISLLDPDRSDFHSEMKLVCQKWMFSEFAIMSRHKLHRTFGFECLA